MVISLTSPTPTIPHPLPGRRFLRHPLPAVFITGRLCVPPRRLLYMYMHTYIRTYLLTYIHTYIHLSIRECMHACGLCACALLLVNVYLFCVFESSASLSAILIWCIRSEGLVKFMLSGVEDAWIWLPRGCRMLRLHGCPLLAPSPLSRT